MADRQVQRRLATVLAADVAGYSRLMDADQEGTYAIWRKARTEIIDPRIAEHEGTIVKHTGDGFLAEFPSVQSALECAVAVQEKMKGLNADRPADKRFQFRIGINIGDIIVDEEDIHGDGVNIAARLESLADDGGICLSGEAHALVQKQVDYAFEDLGDQSLKNISLPVRVYAVRQDSVVQPKRPNIEKPAIAVLPFDNMSGDPDQEYLADGLTEDIITALSLWRSFPVIARNSTFAYKGQSPDIRVVARELGARSFAGVHRLPETVGRGIVAIGSTRDRL